MDLCREYKPVENRCSTTESVTPAEWLIEYDRLLKACRDSETGIDRTEPFYSRSQLLARIAREKAINEFELLVSKNTNIG